VNRTPTNKPTTVDEYLAGIDRDKRAALQRLRNDIHVAMPGAEECISYQMPGFRVDGRVVVWMGAGANHCAFYPGGIVESMKAELKKYETSKGTIRFAPERPLPASLVRKIVRARLAQNAAKKRVR
jgi:uncharacterized protein YdhG (YjbR/CyaY superfamily)